MMLVAKFNPFADILRFIPLFPFSFIRLNTSSS